MRSLTDPGTRWIGRVGQRRVSSCTGCTAPGTLPYNKWQVYRIDSRMIHNLLLLRRTSESNSIVWRRFHNRMILSQKNAINSHACWTNENHKPQRPSILVHPMPSYPISFSSTRALPRDQATQKSSSRRSAWFWFSTRPDHGHLLRWPRAPR